MRIFGSLLLCAAATALGLFGSVMFGVSGLTLAGPGLTVIDYADSDGAEPAIGIGMGIVAVIACLSVFFAAAWIGVGGDHPSRARRVTVWIVVSTGVIVVLAAMIAVLATPPPDGAYSLPDGNRA